MPGAAAYLLPARRPDALPLNMVFQEGKSSLGGEEATPAPQIQVKLQAGKLSLFRLNFKVKVSELVVRTLCFCF